MSARPADLMRTARAQEAEEHADALVRIATELGQSSDTIREARICDCTDGAHEYAPTTRDWEWMPSADVEGVRVFHAGVHVRYRTTVTVWIEAA